jgi:hypothetical protein
VVDRLETVDCPRPFAVKSKNVGCVLPHKDGHALASRCIQFHLTQLPSKYANATATSTPRHTPDALLARRGEKVGDRPDYVSSTPRTPHSQPPEVYLIRTFFRNSTVSVVMGPAAGPEALARRLGVEDDTDGLTTDFRRLSQASNEDKEQLATHEHLAKDSWVLLLVDVHSHPVSDCHISS